MKTNTSRRRLAAGILLLIVGVAAAGLGRKIYLAVLDRDLIAAKSLVLANIKEQSTDFCLFPQMATAGSILCSVPADSNCLDARVLDNRILQRRLLANRDGRCAGCLHHQRPFREWQHHIRLLPRYAGVDAGESQVAGGHDSEVAEQGSDWVCQGWTDGDTAVWIRI